MNRWRTDLLNNELPKIEQKMAALIANKRYEKAISMLESYVGRHPYAQVLHNHLGQLYFEQSNYIKAGKQWYCKECKNEDEEKCVVVFSKRYGNDPAHILKNLIYEHHFSLTMLDQYTLRCLTILLQATINKYGALPGFAKNLFEFLGSNNHLKSI